MFHALYGLPIVNLRIFMVYGPEQRAVKKLIPSTILSLIRKRSPQISSGSRLIDWIYVEDVVDAMVTVAMKEGLSGIVIDVGSGKTISIKQLVERLVKLMNPHARASYGALTDRIGEMVRVADVLQTRQFTGWVPQTSFG